MICFEDGLCVDRPSERQCERLILLELSELESEAGRLATSYIELPEPIGRVTNKFESRVELDYIVLNVPTLSADPFRYRRAYVYFAQAFCLIVHEQLKEADALEQVVREEGLMVERALLRFFALLTAGDNAWLQEIDEDIEELEDALLTTQRSSYTRDIIALRKRLLVYKRYIEGLVYIFDDMEANNNELLTKRGIKELRLIAARVDRLYRATLGLRDYVTQVREAYQAQVDISLNQTMKLFTVITAIFLPLTLIAGWYGMNLQMPEYAAPWAYPAVIVVSLTIAVGCIVYFKRHKWF